MTKSELTLIAIKWLRENEDVNDETPVSERSVESQMAHGIVEVFADA